MLDAFEVVIVGNVLGNMTSSLSLFPFEGSLVISGFLIGAVGGSFLFGYLADKYGRKKVFLITLLMYSLGTFLMGFAWDFYSTFFSQDRSGGEFAAIHAGGSPFSLVD